MSMKDKLIQNYVSSVKEMQKDFVVLGNSGYVNIAVKARFEKRLDRAQKLGADLMASHGVKPAELAALTNEG